MNRLTLRLQPRAVEGLFDIKATNVGDAWLAIPAWHDSDPRGRAGENAALGGKAGDEAFFLLFDFTPFFERHAIGFRQCGESGVTFVQILPMFL